MYGRFKRRLYDMAGGGLMIVLALGLTVFGCSRPADNPATPADNPATNDDSNSTEDRVGLLQNDPGTCDGYTLFAPQFFSTTTYLIDMQGRVVQTWESDFPPGQVAYLLENGHLLRAGMLVNIPPGGAGGRVQEFTWDGDLVWDFNFIGDDYLAHHDIEKLPNGNVLLIVWAKKSAQEAIAAGRNPEIQGDGELRPDFIVEVKPTGKTTGEVVWEWHVWHHLIQDHDVSRANYGDVAAHPELIDINYATDWAEDLSKPEMDKLRSLGYVGPSTGKKRGSSRPDWTHINSIAYHAELDQILLSVLGFNEIWVIDHSTTTAEAAGHSGGRSGKGGDLLYRWGNPHAYRAGKLLDQQLFAQHDAHWIPHGLPGEGRILLFNNGRHRPDGNYSSVDEIVSPIDDQGRYLREAGAPFGPERPIWSYTAPHKPDFYSMYISGAQRLDNGNTLICSGLSGTIFEVTPAKKIVWKYKNPVTGQPGPHGEVFGRPWWMRKRNGTPSSGDASSNPQAVYPLSNRAGVSPVSASDWDPSLTPAVTPRAFQDWPEET